MRGGDKMDMEFTMGSRNRYPYLVKVNPAATKQQVQMRRQWLTGKTEALSLTASR